MSSKYQQGKYQIVLFNEIGSRRHKILVAKNYLKAMAKRDKYVAGHPGHTGVILLVMSNSAHLSEGKWGYRPNGS